MTDIDLFNLVALYEYLKLTDTSQVENNEFRTRDFYSEDNANPIELERISLESTIEKLKRTDGLTYSEGGIGQVGKAKGAFVISNLTKELYRIIKTTQILD